MIGTADVKVITDTLNLPVGGTKTYLIPEFLRVYLYGYTHNLLDGKIEVNVKKNDAIPDSIYCVSPKNQVYIYPVKVVCDDGGLLLIKALENLANVEFKICLYYQHYQNK